MHVLWHCSALASAEYCALEPTPRGHQLHGTLALPLGASPCQIRYDVRVDHGWSPSSAHAVVTTPGAVRRIALRVHRHGSWSVDGRSRPDLDGCGDVDLGWSPATNTIPIRRLDLAVGASAVITAAWVRFPELDVVANPQRYDRLAIDRWRYRSGAYDFELQTDPASGLVLSYGADLWRAAAVSAE